MDDGSQETEMTVVLRWQRNREGDDPRLIVQLEDGEGREWDPNTNAAPITGFLPAGWPRGSALAFKRTTEER
jgi:hypothetical protein